MHNEFLFPRLILMLWCRSGLADPLLCSARYVCHSATSTCIGRRLPRLRLTTPVFVGDGCPQSNLHSLTMPNQQCPGGFVAHGCFPDTPSRPCEANHSSAPAVGFPAPPSTTTAPPPPHHTFSHELQLQLDAPAYCNAR